MRLTPFRLRPLTSVAALGTLLLAGCAMGPGDAGQMVSKDYFAFYGGGSKSPGAGLSLGHFNPATGELTAPSPDVAVTSPSFFILSADHRHLYSTNESGNGNVSAFAVDAATGGLTLLNTVPSGGKDPCHVSLDHTGRYLAVANYTGGSVDMFALRADGSIGDRTFADQHSGKGPNPDRQDAAHAHCVVFDPSNRFLLTCDLGLDQVMVYKFDETTGRAVPNDPAFVSTAPGYGPRHLVFSPDGKTVYVTNELLPFVNAYHWDGVKGVLTPFQSIARLPAGTSADQNTGAEVIIAASGRFVYASNRDIAKTGHDSVTVFAVDAATGGLTAVQNLGVQQIPRFITLDPSGQWLLVANQDSNSILRFAVDATTGKLTPHGSPIAAPMPECIQFMAAP